MAPKYLYKILDQEPPEPLPETLPPTELDQNDGFIHLSNAEQTPITAKLFFKDFDELWILRLDSEKLDGRLEFTTDENAGVENGCAHVHESQKGLGSGNVLEVIHVGKPSSEDWDQVERLKVLTDD
jgi:uncharacterized protein (DUF952 family)